MLLLAGVLGLLVVFLVSVKISKNPFWGFLALTFFLPFERIPTLEIADFSLKINHIIGGLLIVLTLLDMIFNRRKIRSNPASIPIALLVVSFLLSFISNGLQMTSLVFLILNLFAIGLFLVTYQLVNSKQNLTKLSKPLIWSSWLIIIYGFYQFFGDLAGFPTGIDPGYGKAVFGFPRIQAFAKEPLYLGHYLLIPLSVGFAHYFSKDKKWSLPLLLGLSVIFILTISRGAYLGAIGALLVFVLFYAKRVFTIRNFTLAVAGLLGAIVVVGVIFTQLGQDSKEKFLSHITVQDFGNSESTQGRLNAFSIAIDAWRTSPWTGIGLGNYGLFSADFIEDTPQSDDIVNNQYLEYLAETGIVGLGSFLLLIWVITWHFFKAYRWADDEIKPWLVGLFAAFFGTLVQYNFFSTVAIMHIWVFFGLLLATSQLANKR